MSELIDNAQKKKDLLKHMILELNQGGHRRRYAISWLV